MGGVVRRASDGKKWFCIPPKMHDEKKLIMNHPNDNRQRTHVHALRFSSFERFAAIQCSPARCPCRRAITYFFTRHYIVVSENRRLQLIVSHHNLRTVHQTPAEFRGYLGRVHLQSLGSTTEDASGYLSCRVGRPSCFVKRVRQADG